ncbi:MAG: bifunctional methylenetetrahydrofolate dehydrogenase/methenyltetrahydrofolate cyclohydrolase FolD [Chitinophagales bacterium]|nr:bifunctional methylenetetrahydrofolate dehydrogenase/methenyltetrahydrofolate cyclohydrolase FolD [Chitinophagales bacterium]MDW8273010.1 bifunctional methylenetetrahydrofolate dehydrogenase/methenyltetrahydrofolate cyclohydrolase FolD [Chitinophagales bacterium]
MQLIDGKLVAQKIRQDIAAEVQKMNQHGLKPPHLAAVLVGNDGGSQSYVENKVKACKEVGFHSTLIHLDEKISEEELLNHVHALNENKDIDGFIVQLPLPKHIESQRILLEIDPAKDVDGFHPANMGKMVLGLPCFISATPLGILKLFEYYKIETKGKRVAVIGRSHIVGRPISILLSSNTSSGNATVTLCHSHTHDLKEITRNADIIVAAIGKPESISADMVSEGAVVIDVGTTRVTAPEKKSGYVLKGDVHFESVAPKCSYITPVPGGVGPMTVTALLLNTLQAARQRHLSQ